MLVLIFTQQKAVWPLRHPPLWQFVSQSKVRLILAPDWTESQAPPGFCRAWPSVSMIGFPPHQSSDVQPISTLCPSDSISYTFTGDSATIQDVGYVCVPHVCASQPEPLEAQGRTDRFVFSGPDRRCGTDVIHGQAVCWSRRRYRWTSAGYPSGKASTAAATESGEVTRRMCALDLSTLEPETAFYGKSNASVCLELHPFELPVYLNQGYLHVIFNVQRYLKSKYIC